MDPAGQDAGGVVNGAAGGSVAGATGVGSWGTEPSTGSYADDLAIVRACTFLHRVNVTSSS